RVQLIFHERNKGYGAALRSGFRHATREWIFYTDGDGQYDVRELAELLDKAGEDVDAVFGYKISRHDPAYRIAIGITYRDLMRWLFGFHTRDLSCDFRLIRRSALQGIDLDLDSGAICVKLVLELERAGARIAECPVHHYERRYGRSQFFRPRHLAATAIELIKYWRARSGRHGRR
ncbi:MAG: glycosyltransferase family 2 protein, partial [Burkholderiales bacterium]